MATNENFQAVPILVDGKFAGNAKNHIDSILESGKQEISEEVSGMVSEKLSGKLDAATFYNYTENVPVGTLEGEAVTIGTLAKAQGYVIDTSPTKPADYGSTRYGVPVVWLPGGSVGAADGEVKIFSTLAEAQAYEEANPGAVALTTEPQTPDTSAPVTGTLSVSVAHTSAILSVAGASDDRAVTGYSFKVGSGAWSGWQSGTTYTASGLTPSTQYSFQHRVTDKAGNVTVGSAVSATTNATPPPAPGEVVTSDEFTYSGAILGKSSTATLGGTPMTWGGAAGMESDGSVLKASTTASGATTLPVGLKDVKVEFTLVALPTTGSLSIRLRNPGGGSSHGYVLNILPNSLRVQKFTAAGGTILSGAMASLGTASVGQKFSITLKGDTQTVTGVRNTGIPFTLTANDVETTLTGNNISVDASAGSGAAIDNLVVTAQ